MLRARNKAEPRCDHFRSGRVLGGNNPGMGYINPRAVKEIGSTKTRGQIGSKGCKQKAKQSPSKPPSGKSDSKPPSTRSHDLPLPNGIRVKTRTRHIQRACARTGIHAAGFAGSDPFLFGRSSGRSIRIGPAWEPCASLGRDAAGRAVAAYEALRAQGLTSADAPQVPLLPEPGQVAFAERRAGRTDPSRPL